MPVDCVQEGRALTIQVSGEVDHHDARAIMEEVSRQLDAALPRNLTMDLSGVTFMDSSGIALVLRAYQHMGRLQGSMTVTHVPDQAMKVLKAAGIDHLIPME